MKLGVPSFLLFQIRITAVNVAITVAGNIMNPLYMLLAIAIIVDTIVTAPDIHNIIIKV